MTILLKNGMNDTSLWNLQESTRYRNVNFYTTQNYFLTNGVFSERLDPNGVYCDSYTITCIFDIQTTENGILLSVGKLTGLVSLLIPKSTSASTSLQTVLFNSTKNEVAINASVISIFQTCLSSIDCSISPTSYKLNEEAIFLLKLNDSQFHSTYYLRNLYLTITKDQDSPLDITSLITQISQQNITGEIMFKIPMIMVPQNYLTIGIRATLKTSATRMLENELEDQGLFNFVSLSISENTDKVAAYSTTYFLIIGFLVVFLILF